MQISGSVNHSVNKGRHSLCVRNGWYADCQATARRCTRIQRRSGFQQVIQSGRLAAFEVQSEVDKVHHGERNETAIEGKV